MAKVSFSVTRRFARFPFRVGSFIGGKGKSQCSKLFALYEDSNCRVTHKDEYENKYLY